MELVNTEIRTEGTAFDYECNCKNKITILLTQEL